MAENRIARTAADTAAGPWSALANHWRLLGSPLLPTPEDLQRLHRAWLDSLPAGPPARTIDVLLLGVTPEFARFAWAPETSITAVDASEAMIRAVWPGNAPGRAVLHGDWRRLPFGPASFDLMLCDNGPTLFIGRARLGGLARELRRVLRPTGRVVFRNFSRPARPESVDAVLRDARAGAVDNFHVLKLRLLMALHGDDAEVGVRLGDVWECVQEHFPDRAALAERIGCGIDTVGTIDAYRGNDSRYSFYTLAETARGFAGFDYRIGPPGRYPFAEHCPVSVLTPTP